MRAALYVLKEITANMKRVLRLALYENKAKVGGMVFNKLWNVLNPLLQILVYWFVFGVGLKAQTVGDVPYVIWLTIGLLPWMSISQAMTTSSNSIFHDATIVKNISFPLSIIPMKSVIGAWVEHFYSLLVIFAVLLVGQVQLTWFCLEVVYYYIAGFCFLTAFSLFTSSITVVFKDFQRFLQPIIRLLFYVSNVVWSPSQASEKWANILKLNPLSYLIDGYRNCLIYGNGISVNASQAIYFWVFTLVLFVLGAMLHVKLRDGFIDMI